MELFTMTAEWEPPVKDLYTEAFPKKERKPWRMIKRQIRKGQTEALVLFETVVEAFVIATKSGDKVLIEYLAVHPSRRGLGVGTQLLEEIQKRYASERLLLEIERVDVTMDRTDVRVKRLAFYENCGFRRTGMHLLVYGVPMELLVFRGGVTKEEYLGMYDMTVGKRLTKRFIKLEE